MVFSIDGSNVTISCRIKVHDGLSIHFVFGSRVGLFGDGRLNGTISSWVMCKIVTGCHLGIFHVVISDRAVLLRSGWVFCVT